MWCNPLLCSLSNWFLRWMISVCWTRFETLTVSPSWAAQGQMYVTAPGERGWFVGSLRLAAARESVAGDERSCVCSVPGVMKASPAQTASRSTLWPPVCSQTSSPRTPWCQRGRRWPEARSCRPTRAVGWFPLGPLCTSVRYYNSHDAGLQLDSFCLFQGFCFSSLPFVKDVCILIFAKLYLVFWKGKHFNICEVQYKQQYSTFKYAEINRHKIM